MLIEEVLEIARGAWRFRWYAVLAAYVIAIPGWLAIFALGDRYEASARVFVDMQTALHPVLQGLTVEQDVAAQLNLVRQSLLDGAQLEDLARDTGVLTAQTTSPRRKERALDELQQRVDISVSSASPNEKDRALAGSIYDITYIDSDRPRALRVVDTLVTRLIDQTQGGKREGSESAQKFLEAQISQYESQLRAAEDRLADFKKRNLGMLPTEQGGYFAQLQAELAASNKAENDLSIALARREELHRQLKGGAAIAAVGVGTGAPGSPGAVNGNDTVSRINEMRARLDDLLLRFTDAHPDVVAARETLRELQQRRANEIESLRQGDPNVLVESGAAANPVYQSIQLALNNTALQIASLRGELQQHNARTAELRKMLDTAPRVEAEYASLNRDYDVNKAQYTALLANYAKARLGEQADNAGSVRFEIVQPPTAAIQPVYPRRGPLMAYVLAAALVAGTGLACLMHLQRPVLGTSRTLRQLTGLPVYGVVSPAFPEQLRLSRYIEVRRFSGGVAGLLVAFGVALWLNRQGVRIPMQVIGSWMQS